MTVVTRFAPSPTGYLHIGSARTALFNFLYARHTGGKFLLRIEDTDKERSTQIAVDAILEGLKWLEISHDGEIVFQSKNIKNHQQAADDLVKLGKAYYCLTSAEEINQKREISKQEGKSFIFESEWRDRNLTQADLPPDAHAVVRLKVDKEGSTEINDLVQEVVSVSNDTLDDMVLLRSDGTPTYMLAVVVDDHEAGVTHVIRGDDHLSNTFRQLQIYKALSWPVPQYAHIPLIHSKDGARLSKRHGAVGIEAYKEMGFLQEAINNYLLRLGWGHGDDEIISREDAIKWFDVVDVNKGPAKMDFDKMLHLNSHYIKHSDDQFLADKILPKVNLSADKSETLLKAISCLKNRVKTLVELAEQAQPFLAEEPIAINQQAAELLKDKTLLQKIYYALTDVNIWDEQNLKDTLNSFCNSNNMKMGQIGPVLRAALTGTTTAPGIFDIMTILRKEKSLLRIKLLIA